MKSLLILCCLGFLLLLAFSIVSVLESLHWHDSAGVGLSAFLAVLSLCLAVMCGAGARALCREEQRRTLRSRWKRFPTPDDNDF